MSCKGHCSSRRVDYPPRCSQFPWISSAPHTACISKSQWLASHRWDCWGHLGLRDSQCHWLPPRCLSSDGDFALLQTQKKHEFINAMNSFDEVWIETLKISGQVSFLSNISWNIIMIHQDWLGIMFQSHNYIPTTCLNFKPKKKAINYHFFLYCPSKMPTS